MPSRRVLPITLPIAECSSSSPGSSDGRPLDLTGDSSRAHARFDRPGADARADLSADVAKMPAHWTTVPIAKLTMVGHSMTLLKNGDVLAPLHLVVAYDAKASPPGWDALPNMPHPRYAAEGVRLQDGSVLVAGGVANAYLRAYASELDRLFP